MKAATGWNRWPMFYEPNELFVAGCERLDGRFKSSRPDHLNEAPGLKEKSKMAGGFVLSLGGSSTAQPSFPMSTTGRR